MRSTPEEGTNPPSYSLKAVLTLNGRNLTGAMNDHYSGYTQIRSWMVEKLGVTSDRMCTNREMVNIRSLTSLGTSLRKRPDVVVVMDSNLKEVVVQIEVESETLSKTIRKLALGLVDQLRWLRNHDDSIMQCSGFYFMRHHGLGHVIQVDVQWNDRHFLFFVSEHKLPLNNVDTAVALVFHTQVDHNTRVKACKCNNFTLPLSSPFIAKHFGARARQYRSRQSVVIVRLKVQYSSIHCYTAKERSSAVWWTGRVNPSEAYSH